jgi:hypothetical protein
MKRLLGWFTIIYLIVAAPWALGLLTNDIDMIEATDTLGYSRLTINTNFLLLAQGVDTNTGSLANYLPLAGGTMSGGVTNVAAIQWSGGTSTQGTVTWNATEETLDLICDGAVLQLGQEVYWQVKNDTASPLTEGQLVYASGTDGVTGRVKVAPYIGTNLNAHLLMGIVTEDIAASGNGKITHLGKVRGIDTTNWDEGDILYPSWTVAGGLTNVVPASTNVSTPVAFVITKHASLGTIAVRIHPVDENEFVRKELEHLHLTGGTMSGDIDGIGQITWTNQYPVGQGSDPSPLGTGHMYYSTAENAYRWYNGSTWATVGSGGGGGGGTYSNSYFWNDVANPLASADQPTQLTANTHNMIWGYRSQAGLTATENVILGYDVNVVSDNQNVVIGFGNDLPANTGGYCTMIGGYGLQVLDGQQVTAIGGWNNLAGAADPDHSTIIGGFQNSVYAEYCTVIGGYELDQATSSGADYSTLIGGNDNTVTTATQGNTIIGGGSHVISGASGAGYSGIWGGSDHDITSAASDGYNAVVGGQTHDLLTSSWAFMGGGQGHYSVGADWSACLGGKSNRELGTYSVILGGTLCTNDGLFNAAINSHSVDMASTTARSSIQGSYLATMENCVESAIIAARNSHIAPSAGSQSNRGLVIIGHGGFIGTGLNNTNGAVIISAISDETLRTNNTPGRILLAATQGVEIDGYGISTDPIVGEMYCYNSTSNLVLTSASTWYEVDALDTAGPNNNGFGFGDNALTATVAGVYSVAISCSFNGSASTHYDIALSVDDVIQNNIRQTRSTGTSTQTGSATASGTVALSAGSVVKLEAQNTSGASKNFDAADINVTLRPCI